MLLVGLVASLVLAVGWRTGAQLTSTNAAADTAPVSTPDHQRSATLPARVVHSITAALQVRRTASDPAPMLGLAAASATLTVLLAWVLVQSARAASLHRRVVLAPLPSRAPPRR